MAERIWTAEGVADHFEEAFRTLRKLPPVKAQGYFTAWPDENGRIAYYDDIYGRDARMEKAYGEVAVAEK